MVFKLALVYAKTLEPDNVINLFTMVVNNIQFKNGEEIHKVSVWSCNLIVVHQDLLINQLSHP